MPRKRPIQIAATSVKFEISRIENITVLTKCPGRRFSNQLLVPGTLQVLVVMREDDDDVLVLVCRGDCSKLLLQQQRPWDSGAQNTRDAASQDGQGEGYEDPDEQDLNYQVAEIPDGAAGTKKKADMAPKHAHSRYA